MSIESSYGSLNSFLLDMESDIRENDKKEALAEYPSIHILNLFHDNDLEEKEVDSFYFL